MLRQTNQQLVFIFILSLSLRLKYLNEVFEKKVFFLKCYKIRTLKYYVNYVTQED